MGIIISQYKDPYKTISISWNVSQGFGSRCSSNFRGFSPPSLPWKKPFGWKIWLKDLVSLKGAEKNPDVWYPLMAEEEEVNPKAFLTVKRRKIPGFSLMSFWCFDLCFLGCSKSSEIVPLTHICHFNRTSFWWVIWPPNAQVFSIHISWKYRKLKLGGENLMPGVPFGQGWWKWDPVVFERMSLVKWPHGVCWWMKSG